MITPHKFFIQFTLSIKHDHKVLLDLLMSPETQFLLYLTKYLKVVSNEWTLFVDECNKKAYIQNTDDISVDDDTTDDVTVNIIEKNEHKTNQIVQSVCEQQDDELEIIKHRNCKLEKDQIQTVDLQDEKVVVLSQNYEAVEIENGCERSTDLLVSYDLDSDEELSAQHSDSDLDDVLQKIKNEKVEVKESFLDTVMSMFIRLRFALERLDKGGLFTYNINPVIKLLHVAESLYESPVENQHCKC